MNKKISKKTYDEIKQEYLSKKSILSIIYLKYHKNHDINMHQFNQIIKKIRTEERIPENPKNKEKRKNNPFSFYDKHPNSYPT